MKFRNTINTTINCFLLLILLSFTQFKILDHFDFELAIFNIIITLSAYFITTDISTQKLNHDENIIDFKMKIFKLFEGKTKEELDKIGNNFQNMVNERVLTNIQTTLLSCENIKYIKLDTIKDMKVLMKQFQIRLNRL